ncbi:transmembrane and death domain protein 1-like [Kryptolebias marmoratus]|uniref:transmembrane and death domain protein 1-like n=1 Tax=Kryptolebias marmoratus TaxID=37003 RepID=UPI000D52F3EC|nr:transmembrane and death domain protein 1-like [Kryptolebias marmoratus]
MYELVLSVTMKVWKIYLLFIFLPLSSTLGEDTVAEDIGVHQLERLVEMLTPKECEDLLFALSHPEEDIFRHIDRLSPENNQLDLSLRAKRDTSSAADGGTQCQAALTDWLLKYGEKTYYDRLSRALQHIGRIDIAIEVGKNINQDKALSLKRYVEDYHKYVSSLNIQSANEDTKNHQHQRVKKTKLSDLTWRDLDLILERAPVPLYSRGPLNVVLPLLYGILLGFGGTLLAGVFLLLVINHSSQRRQQSSTPTGQV